MLWVVCQFSLRKPLKILLSPQLDAASSARFFSKWFEPIHSRSIDVRCFRSNVPPTYFRLYVFALKVVTEPQGLWAVVLPVTHTYLSVQMLARTGRTISK